MKTPHTLALILAFVVLVVLAVYIKTIAPQEQGIEAVSVSGTVTAVNLEQMMVDGPGLVTLSTEQGVRVIAVPSFGRNTCAKDADLADVTTIKLGDKVEVRGEISEENYIVPCIDSSHYLRVLSSGNASKPEPTPPVVSVGKCYVGGCSSEICSDRPDAVSNCMYTESYACYKTARCERQTAGACGWTETAELKMCLAKAR